MTVYTTDDAGNYVPATPIGWREEHNLFVRVIYRILGWKHCCDEEKTRYARN